jgi:hypothetical protein
MGNNKVNSRIVKTVKAKSDDCITKPLNIRKYKVIASKEEDREKIIEENVIAEFKDNAIGQS